MKGVRGTRRDLTPDELELLRWIAGRPVPGPLRWSAQKDWLRKTGYIEAQRRDFREGQDCDWIVTAAGQEYLALRAAAA